MRRALLICFIVLASLAAAGAGFFVGAQPEPASSPSLESERAQDPSLTAVLETPKPLIAAPTPTPLPDRASCDQIRGTEYRSDAEQQWFSDNCLPPPPPPVPAANPPAVPGPEVAGERWILVDIANQETTAMIGDRALYTALVTTGKADWETPKGTFKIVRRVQNETMTSASIGAEEHYVLKDVLYTQYFTTVGHALHLNYWRDDSYFGSVPSSHGCVGMRLADAEFFWRFATNGTRVTIQ